MKRTRLPGIAQRLRRTLGLGVLAWALGMAAAAALAVHEEVDELMDDTLRASAEGLAPLLRELPDAGPALPASTGGGERFAWLLEDEHGRVLRCSSGVDKSLAEAAPHAGFSKLPRWRVYGQALDDHRWLVVAQTRAERREARTEVVWMVVLASLAVGLMGLPLLAWRLRQELLPLARLSVRLQGWADQARSASPRALSQALGEPERRELASIHAALQDYGERLAERLEFEAAFAPQAAHLLRTPLAGMDAQLAVALKEAPPEALPRLQRLRAATTRLQHLVLALLRLFRSEAPLQRQAVDAQALAQQLPAPGIELRPGPALPLQADPELLAAALLNLFDNAQRHGARSIWLEPAGAQRLRICDDGAGMPASERATLAATLASASAETGARGLGLRLAALIARAHGGTLQLPETDSGFIVELDLGHG